MLLPLQDISTCNLGPLLPGLEVDDSLDELFPLLSLEAPTGFSSMAYTQHLISGLHYLFLGTHGRRLFQVRSNRMKALQNGIYKSSTVIAGKYIP